MKKAIYMIFIILMMGCSHHTAKTTQEIVNEMEQSQPTIPTTTSLRDSENFGDTRSFKNVFNIESLVYILKKYNYRYKIVCVDTRNWTRNKREILKTRRVIAKFGKNLGRKAIIANLVYKTSRKRDYVRRVSQNLGRYYNLDTQAPFLIFYKKNGRSYVPYKIVPIASLSKQRLKKSLSLLTNAINSGQSSKKVYASLERITENMYASN